LSGQSPTDIEVTLMLCDAAQSVGGKLYILGGCWNQMQVAPGTPVTLSLAVRVRIPWDRANEPIPFRAALRDADGEPVTVGDENTPVEATGNLEVGRPPGLDRGTPLDAVLALPFVGIPIPAGRYVWVIEIAGEPHAREPFTVR